MTRLFGQAAILGASITLFVCALKSNPLDHTLDRTAELMAKPREERLIERYGECDPAGYGYMERVLKVFPDPALRPTLRYQRYNRKTEYQVEPVRFRALPSVMVGIGFSDAALQDGVIDSAHRVSDAWEFIARRDYDALTAFEVDTKAIPPGTLVRITVHDGARVLWSGEAPSTASETLRVELPRPIKPFAIARGPDPFRVTVTPAESIVAVRALGRELDVSNHVLAHREGNCLVAFERSWFESLSPDDRRKWTAFTSAIPAPERR